MSRYDDDDDKLADDNELADGDSHDARYERCGCEDWNEYCNRFGLDYTDLDDDPYYPDETYDEASDEASDEYPLSSEELIQLRLDEAAKKWNALREQRVAIAKKQILSQDPDHGVTMSHQHCPHCGETLATCLDCGAILHPDSKFCATCGASVGGITLRAKLEVLEEEVRAKFNTQTTETEVGVVSDSKRGIFDNPLLGPLGLDDPLDFDIPL